ncbi:Clavaminate synthase-like protein [Panus rudis PR-1116 ss-1]|nr:Clavaminate synthase-like protein [Panus rudis PR-1116 ss-1]
MSNNLQLQPVLEWISQEYFDLNGSHYETFHGIPSGLEFSKWLRIARPVLIKGCAAPKALAKWSTEYLATQCADSPISVAVTPNGRADAITKGPDGKQYFAEPHIEQMTMRSFLSTLNTEDEQTEVRYLQSQNGNLYTSDEGQESEFHALLADVPNDLPWCSEALESPPDAVNLWIGNSKSITSVHSVADPYENIYSVIRGSKTFTLLPPTEGWCMQERTYPHARYERASDASLVLVPSAESTPPIRWSSILDPSDHANLPPQAHTLQITVNAGESLYLPAGWWHYVRQTGLTIAVNYWYDLESRGMNWVWLNLLRGGNSEPPPANETDSELPVS